MAWSVLTWKILRIFQSRFLSGVVCAETRHSSYTKTLYNIMGILSSIFGNNKKLPFKKTVRFERNESEFEVNIGDEVKIWNKPNTKQLNLYAKGSSGGNGLVGTKIDSTISH